jgi:hypothetical protein
MRRPSFATVPGLIGGLLNIVRFAQWHAKRQAMPVSQDAEAEASKPMKECFALRNFRVALFWYTRFAPPMDWILF